MKDTLKIYYENELKSASLSGDGMVVGFLPYSAVSDFRQDWVYFAGESGSISAEFAQGALLTAVCIADCNAASVSVDITDGAVNIGHYDISPNPKGIATLLFDSVIATGIAFTFGAFPAVDGHCGKLYAGGVLEVEHKKWGTARRKLSADAKGNRSLGGQWYGVKKQTYKTYSVSIQYQSEEAVDAFENYEAKVQTIEPHFIEPYNPEKFPPMFVKLDSMVEASKRDDRDWYWDFGTVSWSEVL